MQAGWEKEREGREGEGARAGTRFHAMLRFCPFLVLSKCLTNDKRTFYVGNGIGNGIGIGNWEFKPDSRALPDAADFDLYLIVCKQRDIVHGIWMDSLSHTKRETRIPYTYIRYIYIYVLVTYAGDLFDFWHEVDRLLQIELIACIFMLEPVSPTGWMMMMTNRSYRLNLGKFSMEFANYCYKINCGEVAQKTSVLGELN